jgi:hypothetical protein
LKVSYGLRISASKLQNEKFFRLLIIIQSGILKVLKEAVRRLDSW